MKNVMKRAWELAKEGVKKFGGKVKEYLAEALRIAWTETKAVVGNEKGCVKLVGSEKQVAWAEDIRKKVIAKMDLLISEMEKEVATKSEKKQKAFEKYVEIYEEMKREDKSWFWIETFGRRTSLLDVPFRFRSYVEKKDERTARMVDFDINVAEKIMLQMMK